MGCVIFLPMVPSPGEVSDYDYRSLATYADLLEAERGGASEGDMARFVLHLDASQIPSVARIAVRSHLQRAHWLVDQGFWPLLWCLND